VFLKIFNESHQRNVDIRVKLKVQSIVEEIQATGELERAHQKDAR
jgi:hypothetical protein